MWLRGYTFWLRRDSDLLQDHYEMGGALLMPDSLTHALNMEEKAGPGAAARPPADPEARQCSARVACRRSP